MTSSPITMSEGDYAVFAFPSTVTSPLSSEDSTPEELAEALVVEKGVKLKTTKVLLRVERINDRKMQLVSPQQPPYGYNKLTELFKKPKTFPRSAEQHVAANLGKNPPFGSVFGTRVFFPQKKMKLPPFKKAFLYRELSPREYKILLHDIEQLETLVKDHSLHLDWPFFELHPPRGAVAGEYRVIVKGDDIYEVISLHPKYAEDEFPNYFEILSHELGHALWYQLFPSRLKAKWISLFKEFVQPIPITKDDLAKFLEGVSATPLRDYLASLEDDEAEKFWHVLYYLDTVYHLKLEHVELLLDNEKDSLHDLWPTSVNRIFDADTPISEYAMKNAEEFWCEALRVYATSEFTLPKKIKTAVVRTLDLIKMG